MVELRDLIAKFYRPKAGLCIPSEGKNPLGEM